MNKFSILYKCPPPCFFLDQLSPLLDFWEHVKLCMGSCYLGTLTDIPLGFRLSQSPIDTIPPGGVWGGGAPSRCRPPSFLVVKKKRGSEPKSCFDGAENRAASSLWVGAHRYTRISYVWKLLWFEGDLKPFFFSDKFTKIDLALKGVIRNCSKLGIE